MKIVEIGNIGDTNLVRDVDAKPVPKVGIIIEATPDEIKALPFNPAYAEVTIQKKG